VGVGITQEKQDLEEQHAGGPDAGAATEPRKDEFADDRLDLEEQKGAQKREQTQAEDVKRLGRAGHEMGGEAVTTLRGREEGTSGG
jgi:hypothetical protein